MKPYDQYCPIACSLGLIGERWTLLVVRELLYRPEALHRPRSQPPRIGRTSSRTAEDLESAGLVEKRKLPPPPRRRSTSSPDGARATAGLHELARFGARLMGPPPSDALDEGWLLGALDLALAELADREDGLPDRRRGGLLVDGTAVRIVDGYDVLVEADAIGFYHLVVDRDSEGFGSRGTTPCSSACSTPSRR